MKTLKELQEIKHPDMPEFYSFKPINEADPESVKMAEKSRRIFQDYFSAFVLPDLIEGGDIKTGTHACIMCQHPVNGQDTVIELEINEEGNGNGEAWCHICGYPYRYLHRVVDEDGDLMTNKPLNMLLPYHPNKITEEKLRRKTDGNGK